MGFGPGAGAIALAAAATVLSASLTGPSLSAQAPIQAESGVRLQGSQVGYATTEQLMAVDARMAMEASAGLAAADGSAAGRRRVVRRPAFDTQRPSALQATAQATEPEVHASEPASFLQAYIGAALSDTGSLPPDPSGAAGPAQFILAANGRIRSFSKATGSADLVLNVSANAFFAPVRNSPNVFGPKIRVRPAGRPLVHHRGD